MARGPRCSLCAVATGSPHGRPAHLVFRPTNWVFVPVFFYAVTASDSACSTENAVKNRWYAAMRKVDNSVRMGKPVRDAHACVRVRRGGERVRQARDG